MELIELVAVISDADSELAVTELLTRSASACMADGLVQWPLLEPSSTNSTTGVQQVIKFLSDCE